jgi:voltage-gated potassium channel
VTAAPDEPRGPDDPGRSGDPGASGEVTTDPLAEAAGSLDDLRVRGCMERDEEDRERLAAVLYERLHPAMAVLGLLFLVVVLSQGAATTGTTLHRVLVAVTWVLWAVFAAEYALRLVIAPHRGRFLRRTWWQLLFLAVPFLTMVRALLVLRMARPTRVALAAVRGSRSAAASLTSRAAWLGVVTVIVIFSSADILQTTGAVESYGDALYAAAMAAITGEPSGADDGVGRILDVALALYAVAFFATSAGIVGAFFVQGRGPGSPVIPSLAPPSTVPAPEPSPASASSTPR